MQTQLNVVLNYFSGFSTKDIVKVSRDFTDLVSLQDWNIFRSGKEDTKDAISEIFNSVETIIIVPSAIYFTETGYECTATAKIDIIINGGETLKVVDIIHLTNDLDGWKISKIEAYKQ